MEPKEFHEKFLNTELDYAHVIKAVYGDGPEQTQILCEMVEHDFMSVAANAALIISSAAKDHIKKFKLCLVCSRPHQHKNAFCSAEHAEIYAKNVIELTKEKQNDKKG